MMEITQVRCKQCRKKFKPVSNGVLQFCSTDCKIDWLKSPQGQKQMKITSKKLTKETADSLKTLSEWEKVARGMFQAWIRLRDEKMPCISCGTWTTDVWQGSHYFSAEKYSGLIFNESNVHKSCKQCNKHLHGNLLEYRKGLMVRYGTKYVEDLEAISDINRLRKYTKEELMNIRDEYSFKIKELKK